MPNQSVIYEAIIFVSLGAILMLYNKTIGKHLIDLMYAERKLPFFKFWKIKPYNEKHHNGRMASIVFGSILWLFALMVYLGL